jgi:hypothetical protein
MEVYREDGLYHRLDGPAVTMPNGVRLWYREGKLHCDFGPAETWPDGTQFWYSNGLPHRANGNPAVIHADGSQFWYKNGELFRAAENVRLPVILDVTNKRMKFEKNGAYVEMTDADYNEYRYKYDSSKIKPAR